MNEQSDPSTPPGYFMPEQLPINSTSQALESSRRIGAGECRLFGFTATSTRASGQFIQVFDATALPADGAVPLISIDIPTATAKGMDWGLSGRWFYLGVFLCNSTTQATKTLGAADCLFDAQYL